MKTITVLLPLIAICMCSAALAKSPFDGTWILDTAKSQVTGATFSFHDAGDGALKYEDSQESYTVKLDGTPVKAPLGEEVAMHQTGNDSYSFTSKRNGKLLTDEHWRLSPDGNTLTIDWKTFEPNGKTYNFEEIDARTAPGTGVIGTWKIAKITTDLHDGIVIRTSGKEDVTLTFVTARSTVHAKWDGRDYRGYGPLAPAGVTVALTKTGSREFKLVNKLNGKVMRIMYFKLAADGKSMVADGTDADGKQPNKQVFDKQS